MADIFVMKPDWRGHMRPVAKLINVKLPEDNMPDYKLLVAENRRVMDWLNFLVERGFVAKSQSSVFVWTIAGADFLTEKLGINEGAYNVLRDPQQTTPANYCKHIAEVIDVETAKIFGGWKVD